MLHAPRLAPMPVRRLQRNGKPTPMTGQRGNGRRWQERKRWLSEKDLTSMNAAKQSKLFVASVSMPSLS
jgi:hypothetical protein